MASPVSRHEDSSTDDDYESIDHHHPDIDDDGSLNFPEAIKSVDRVIADLERPMAQQMQHLQQMMAKLPFASRQQPATEAASPNPEVEALLKVAENCLKDAEKVNSELQAYRERAAGIERRQVEIKYKYQDAKNYLEQVAVARGDLLKQQHPDYPELYNANLQMCADAESQYMVEMAALEAEYVANERRKEEVNRKIRELEASRQAFVVQSEEARTSAQAAAEQHSRLLQQQLVELQQQQTAQLLQQQQHQQLLATLMNTTHPAKMTEALQVLFRPGKVNTGPNLSELVKQLQQQEQQQEQQARAQQQVQSLMKMAGTNDPAKIAQAFEGMSLRSDANTDPSIVESIKSVSIEAKIMQLTNEMLQREQRESAAQLPTAVPNWLQKLQQQSQRGLQELLQLHQQQAAARLQQQQRVFSQKLPVAEYTLTIELSKGASGKLGFDVATSSPSNVIDAVQPGSEAEMKGLKKGDRIISINGCKIAGASKEFITTLLDRIERTVKMVVKRKIGA